MDRPLPAPQKPLSKIWADSAAFWEDNPSEKSLMGVLWNTTRQGWHSHRDVNAIHLTAYGEPLLSNTGWAINGRFGYPADYFKETAVASNTVVIGDVNHVGKVGAGVVEGFSAPFFDHASGDSGSALPNGTHIRNFILVHPQDGLNGYFVLFDEVSRTNGTATTSNIALHPPSAVHSIASTNQEYRWVVRRMSTSEVFLSIFLGTSPIGVEVRDGPLSITRGGIFKYLYSTYDLDVSGRRNMVTVLFPHDATHAKAAMSRVSGPGFTGARLDLGGGIRDTALESTGTRVVRHGGISFRGLAALYRTGRTSFFFVRKGRSFKADTTSRWGCDAMADVTIYVKGTRGRVISPGTAVTFYYPGIRGVQIDGNMVPNNSSGSGWVRVTIPAGPHDIDYSL